MITRVLLMAVVVLGTQGCNEYQNKKSNPKPINIIPSEAFFVPGSSGGIYVLVEYLNPHMNIANLVLYDPITNLKVDSGRFMAICPLSDASFIPNPKEQFVKFENDTIWVRSETGKLACWMQKSGRN